MKKITEKKQEMIKRIKKAYLSLYEVIEEK